MEVRSVYKYARISPKKARDVAREIQGLSVSDALDALNFTPRKAAFLIGKTLKSAVANAENNHDLVAEALHVKEANISQGPMFRRFKPRARGSASAIRKRTSHIFIILTDEIGIEEKAGRSRGPKKKEKPGDGKGASGGPAADQQERAAADPEAAAMAAAASEEGPAEPEEAAVTEPASADPEPSATETTEEESEKSAG